jgi:glycosyltransferase involved in cell wall biosynthesis
LNSIQPPTISAIIPCFNHWESLRTAVESIKKQSIPVTETLIIDDGSFEPCPLKELIEDSRIRIIRLNQNRGRGYCRNLAFKETSGEYVLNLDATNSLEERFIEKALPHFLDSQIAAVSGALISKKKDCAVDRWRARHLFHESSLKEAWAEPCTMLITYGTLFARKFIDEVGGFNPKLRFKEDQEMGERLASAGYLIIGDPKLEVYPTISNSVAEVLERYSRWYMDTNEKPSLKGYWHNFKASFRPMMALDLSEGDWGSAFISMLAPHFQLYHSIKANRSK